MPWGHSATLRVRPAVSRRCSPMIPGRLRQPFPCVSSIRPSKSTSGLSPHNAPSAAWTTSPHGIHPRPKPRLTMQVLTSPLRLRRVRLINAERSLRVQSETLLRPTTHSQGRGSCGRGPRQRLHCSAPMPLSCAPPPPLRTRDHCRQPPYITPTGFPDKGKAQTSAFQPGHCSLAERRLIPLRDPGVPWGLCNAPAPQATYGIDPETPQCPRLGICTARRLICRQVLPRAKSDFAQFDLRVNDLDNPWLHSAYLKLRLGLLSLAKDFTALSGGSGGGSDIFRKDNPENSRSNPQARGGQCSGTLGGIIPPNPHFAPTFPCYYLENQHSVSLTAA